VLDAAEERLASAVLQAPAAGVVARRYGIAGARVAAGDPVVELLEIERVAVRGGVPRALASLLRDGGSVSVRAAGEPSAPPRSGTPRRRAGEAPAADGTVGFEVWLENADRRLRPQMLVEIAVDVPVAPVRFSVPLSALRRGIADEPFVFVVVGAEGAARVERRVLTLAGLRRDRVAVVAGVRDGDRVVVRGARLLTVGDVVDVVGEGP
jgi:RND family efflux transporter MFP subunit